MTRLQKVPFKGHLVCSSRFFTTPKQPMLKGIRVVDMTRVLAGPFSTMNLSDLGADVIKIEKPCEGDETRAWGPPFISDSLSSYFACCNRNKKSVAIDYRNKKGHQLLKKLIKSSDVLVENSRPATLRKYGLDYATLKECYPKLIYASLSGYGQTGPSAHRGAYDLSISAEAGLMGITGPENGDPCKVGVAITDLCTGLYVYSGVLAALYHREMTGEGQHIDVSLFASQVSLLANIGSNYLNNGIIAKPLGNAHPSIVPYQSFRTSNGNVVITASNDLQFHDLSEALGWPHLSSNPQFSTNSERVENREMLIGHLAERFEEETTEYWLNISESYSYGATRVNNMKGVFEHEQTKHLDLIKTVQHPVDNTTVSMVGHPVGYSNSGIVEPTAPPLLGQHTEEVLLGIGVSQSEIESLEREGVIQCC